ncbi:hypothetical protein BT69DRAFT_1324651 [Atractiella rhizophila]|nr:hypothetical protein BT69DRAFT_1324651 [Atractiella rhizophila]
MQPTLLFSLLSLFLSSTVVAAGTHSPSGQDLQRFQIRHRPSAISLTKRQNDTDTTDATTDSSVDNTDSSDSSTDSSDSSTDSSDSSTDSLVDGGNNKGIFDGLFGGGDDPNTTNTTGTDPAATGNTASNTLSTDSSTNTATAASTTDSTSTTQSSTTTSSTSSSTTTSKSKTSSTQSSTETTSSSTTDTSLPTNTALNSDADNKKNDSDSGLSKTTTVILIVVGSSIGGAFLIWTLIRKWRFSSSKRFQERMRPISFGPGEGADATPEFGGAVKRNDDSFNEKQGWNQIGDNPYGANVDGGHQQHQRGDSGDSHVTGYGRMNGAPQIPGASLNRQDSWGNRSGYGGYERSHTPAFERAVTPQPPAQQPYAAPQYPGPYGGPPMQVMPPMDPYAQDAQGLPYPGEFNQRMNARPPQPGFDPYYRGGNY